MYRRVKEDEVPRRSRQSKSLFEDTREWSLMRADLERGLKRGEALEIVLTQKDLERIGLIRRTIARWIDAYLQKHGMKQYEVLNFKKDGMDYVVVKYPASGSARRVA